MKPRHHNKWESQYKNINDYFIIPISKTQFFNNYQLYRNLYNSINNELGEQGYMYVVYSSQNIDLEAQFNDFLIELRKHKLVSLYPKRVFLDQMKMMEVYKHKYLI